MCLDSNLRNIPENKKDTLLFKKIKIKIKLKHSRKIETAIINHVKTFT